MPVHEMLEYTLTEKNSEVICAVYCFIVMYLRRVPDKRMKFTAKHARAGIEPMTSWTRQMPRVHRLKRLNLPVTDVLAEAPSSTLEV